MADDMCDVSKNLPPSQLEGLPSNKRGIHSGSVGIDDWEREELAKEKENPSKPVHNPPKKVKVAPVLDPAVKSAEDLALSEMGNTNWVGKLYEFRMAQTVKNEEGSKYTEISDFDVHFPRFSCKVWIHENPETFEDQVTFTSKKMAKQYISKKAIDWLIENRFMPADGSIKFPKAKPTAIHTTPTAIPPRASSTSPTGTPPQSYPALVPDLCHKLGINPPRYEFIQPHPPLCDAYAEFGGDPTVSGKVGEVFNIYGKKQAKEQCARAVYKFLKDIERQRLEAHAHLMGAPQRL